ncbi:PREDICTED: tubulin polyglutamylase TTLL13-like [Dinoponera quadriceps]|uniref:Tubulin polyglutamylase TTLL13-like n=1 Tax=Dinoponera quadriceps TaxID=609295 RepID=A0A6P3Y2K9_DINQU|nr:PREDICTED: tubulin polyglutamylase TTLL13-like [Dinoponera quadriceps]
MRVAVVGAGVIGVTSALAVKSAFPSYNVKIFADAFSPDTTGDGSAGLWSPFLLCDTPAEDIYRWAGCTHRWFEQLWKDGLSLDNGVCLMPVTRVLSDQEYDTDQVWAKHAYGAQKLSGEQLRRLNEEHKSNYKTGWHFLTYTAEPVLLLPWLMKKFSILGGKTESKNVKALHELAEKGYDLIINCSGLGARELVADKTVTPIRGQVYKVKAPWTKHCLLVDDDETYYIIPNVEDVVLGGTHQENDYDCTVREEDSERIHAGCCRVMPSLKAAQISRAWVGLRPGRPRVRLECENLRAPTGKEFKVIHNYGHGGSGVTLCWGCAVDVVEMIRNLKVPELNSKLSEGATDDESVSESDTSFAERSRESAFPNWNSIVPDDSSHISSRINDRIGVIKHDPENCKWKVTMDKSENTEPLYEESNTKRCKGDTVETLRMTKKRKRRFLTICTSSCKYDVVRRVAAQFGMKEVTEDSSWDLYWTDLSISIERTKDMKRFQRVNHFPGMTEICRKDLLARNLNRMLKLFPRDYNFFPKTWCFPADYGDAMTYAKSRRSRTFIIKPDTGCQGRGIYLTRHLKDIKPSERLICQIYIARPFLIDGYKFDLRIYALITSCDPLRIYVYNEGLARFATSKYKEPTGHNTTNMFMHLTNYAINKHSRMYIIDDQIGSKRKISVLNKWLRTQDVDVDELWGKIDEIIIKTALAAYPVLKHSYHACFPTHDKTSACFELLGFDILIDWKLKPYLLEVNHSPSFHTDAQLDKDVKEGLLMDTFDILNLQQYDKKKIIEEDRKRIRERLLQGINGQTNDTTAPTKAEKNENDYIQRQFKWEDEHTGNFRRIFPCPGEDKYRHFFTQNALSVFQDTVASRAREEASRMQREENELKVREEERKKISGKWSEHKIGPESPNAPKKLHSTFIRQEKSTSAGVFNKNINKQDTQGAPTGSSSSSSTLYSFEPEIISESEERERITALAQRDFLIKSYGMLEQIYTAMKRNGTLRPADERKYGLYGRLGHASQSACIFPSRGFHHRRNGHLDGTQIAAVQCQQCSLRENDHGKLVRHVYEDKSDRSEHRRLENYN